MITFALKLAMPLPRDHSISATIMSPSCQSGRLNCVTSIYFIYWLVLYEIRDILYSELLNTYNALYIWNIQTDILCDLKFKSMQSLNHNQSSRHLARIAKIQFMSQREQLQELLDDRQTWTNFRPHEHTLARKHTRVNMCTVIQPFTCTFVVIHTRGTQIKRIHSKNSL